MAIELYPDNGKVIEIELEDSTTQAVDDATPIANLLKSDKTASGIAELTGLSLARTSRRGGYVLNIPPVPTTAPRGNYWLRISATGLKVDLACTVKEREIANP